MGPVEATKTTVFKVGMRVKKIFCPDLNMAPEVDYVGRITAKGFIKLQKDLADPCAKYWLIRPDGRSSHGAFHIVPDQEGV